MSALLVERHPEACRRPAEDAAIARLRAPGMALLESPPLYHLPEDDPIWATLAGSPGPLTVCAWLPPRPCLALLDQHGVRAGIVWLGEDGWSYPEGRWYPVIDRERCVSCGHCRQFCLFGVYAMAGAQVRVASPDDCKAGCPACSRVCPKGAIMFPLYDDPAIAGLPGAFMELDAAGRALFYNRTGKACPRCGLMAPTSPKGEGPACPECGRQPPPAKKKDDLDGLLDDLDRLQERGR